jgi:hypothetical protein
VCNSDILGVVGILEMKGDLYCQERLTHHHLKLPTLIFDVHKLRVNLRQCFSFYVAPEVLTELSIKDYGPRCKLTKKAFHPIWAVTLTVLISPKTGSFGIKRTEQDLKAMSHNKSALVADRRIFLLF